MIATVNLEKSNRSETLSTCKFSQRVANIMTHARLNENVNDRVTIMRLKKRVAELESELEYMRLGGVGGDNNNVTMSKDEKNFCLKLMGEFMNGHVDDPVKLGKNLNERDIPDQIHEPPTRRYHNN